MQLYCPTCRQTFEEPDGRLEELGGSVPCRVCRTILVADPDEGEGAGQEADLLQMGGATFTVADDGKTTMLSADMIMEGKTTVIDSPLGAPQAMPGVDALGGGEIPKTTMMEPPVMPAPAPIGPAPFGPAPGAHPPPPHARRGIRAKIMDSGETVCVKNHQNQCLRIFRIFLKLLLVAFEYIFRRGKHLPSANWPPP